MLAVLPGKKRYCFTISSPRMLFLTLYQGSTLAWRSTVLNKFTLFDRSSMMKFPLPMSGRSRLESQLTSQHRSFESLSPNFWACSKMENTFDVSRCSRRYSVDLSASENISANYKSEEYQRCKWKGFKSVSEFYFNSYLVKFKYGFIV